MATESDRKRRIEEIASTRTHRGALVGIFGAEFCQVCGEFQMWRGWAYTVFRFNDPVANASSFVCATCIKKGNSALILRNRTYRFCESCGRRVERSESLCPECRALLLRDYCEDEPEDILSRLRRTRYVDAVCGTDEELDQFGRHLAGEQESLDDRAES